MPEVNVEINGRKYRMACEEGQQGHLIKLAERFNARDVLAHNMPAIEAEGYRIVLSVHDELLTETPDTDEYSSDTLAAHMSTVPPWAEGLPLAAAGFETTRYRKD